MNHIIKAAMSRLTAADDGKIVKLRADKNALQDKVDALLDKIADLSGKKDDKSTEDRKKFYSEIEDLRDKAGDLGDKIKLMKKRTETAATKFEEGQRIIYCLDDDEWHVGTVYKADAKQVFIKYDDGYVAKKGKLFTDKHLFFYTGGTKLVKKELTDAQAKKVATKTPPASSKTPVKPAAKTAPLKLAPSKKADSYPAVGRMAEIKYNTGPAWRMCFKLTPSAVYVGRGGDDAAKLKPIPKRHVLRWRDPTPEELKSFSTRGERIEKMLVTAKPNSMVRVRYRGEQYVWEFCYRVNRQKGTFSVAGGGGKMRDLPLNIATETRATTEDEQERAAEQLVYMENRRGQYQTRRAKIDYLFDWLRAQTNTLTKSNK